jgi:hypothetical protein
MMIYQVLQHLLRQKQSLDWDAMGCIFLYPLITIVQKICARIGLLTGSGLATNIEKNRSLA